MCVSRQNGNSTRNGIWLLKTAVPWQILPLSYGTSSTTCPLFWIHDTIFPWLFSLLGYHWWDLGVNRVSRFKYRIGNSTWDWIFSTVPMLQAMLSSTKHNLDDSHRWKQTRKENSARVMFSEIFPKGAKICIFAALYCPAQHIVSMNITYKLSLYTLKILNLALEKLNPLWMKSCFFLVELDLSVFCTYLSPSICQLLGNLNRPALGTLVFILILPKAERILFWNVLLAWNQRRYMPRLLFFFKECFILGVKLSSNGYFDWYLGKTWCSQAKPH